MANMENQENLQKEVKNNKQKIDAMINKIYPVGSIYMSMNATSPSTFFGGTWKSIGAGRVLQGADDAHAAGTEIEAGLPNITGYMNRFYGEMAISGDVTSGAFYPSDGYSKTYAVDWQHGKRAVSFDASRCSAIYGKSDTVQPPALAVYIWQRTA